MRVYDWRRWAAQRGLIPNGVFGKTLPLWLLLIFNTEKGGGHQGPRRFRVLEHRGLTERLIGMAIEEHRVVGPGLWSRFMLVAYARS